jgi:DNA-binding transcriptional LysR family regulator
VREHGRLTPTREALHIAAEARHLFAQQKRVSAIIDELRGGMVGRLSIIATPSLGHGILPRVLAAFVQGRPKLLLSFELGSIDEIIDRLVSGSADLGLSISQPRHSALSVRPMAKGRLVCVCPADHELALSERIRITDLNHVKHISYAFATPLGRAIDAVFSAEGLERRYFCEVRHTATALELVAGGLGVALVDNFALIGQANPAVVARPTVPEVPINVHSITSNLFPTSTLALQFQQAFAAYVEAQGDATI